MSTHSNNMSALRIVLVIIATYANHVTLTPPTPPASKTDTMKELDSSERFFTSVVRRVVAINRHLSWVVAGCEISTVLARAYPATTLGKLVLTALTFRGSHHATASSVTPALLAGCGLAVTGALIRVQCYRTLGSQFTFELALKDSYRLCTSGPYSIVRHPSYTGMILNVVGQLLWAGAEGSWVRESGILDTAIGRVVAAISVTARVYGAVSVALRCAQEDRNLKGKFGDEWVEWAKRVRYRLVPGLY